MASQEDLEREAGALRDEIYRAADSGLYPEEQVVLYELNLSVATALRDFMVNPGGDGAAYARAEAACAGARAALRNLAAGDPATLQALVRSVALAVEALEAATGG